MHTSQDIDMYSTFITPKEFTKKNKKNKTDGKTEKKLFLLLHQDTLLSLKIHKDMYFYIKQPFWLRFLAQICP